jgi:hypothetical protein
VDNVAAGEAVASQDKQRLTQTVPGLIFPSVGPQQFPDDLPFHRMAAS